MQKLNKDFLASVFSEINICLNEDQKNAFAEYYDYLISENAKKNLTRITEPDEVVLKHYIDSAMLLKFFDFENNQDLRIVDLGAGAGFPSIPLKICLTDAEIKMIDSINKKVVFLDETIERLGLNKAEAICARAEDILKEEDFRESFDICVSRAVANLSTLSEYCIPFVRVGGWFVSYKADANSEEIEEARNAIGILGGRLDRVESYVLPGTDEKRCLVFIEKIKKTESRYPRRAGIPSKRPL